MKSRSVSPRPSLRKAAAALLLAALLPVLCACGNAKTDSKNAELTMYVGLGNSADYYARLHNLVQQELGIDLKYVYNTTQDTTNAVRLMMRNDDLPADILVTSSLAPESDQENALLDLAKYTNIPDLFLLTKLQELDIDGAVYQLPFCSRLIGVEYNRTLFEEMNWELPSTFEDMVSLKAQAEEAGYAFAVSSGAATGHGFNYLFHPMGSQYLTTPDGNRWFSDFMDGRVSIDAFAAEAAYLADYVDAGLFGEFRSGDWSSAGTFGRERVLFYYNITNDAYSYDGFRYNPDGTLYGVEYGADGAPLNVTPDPQGSAVYCGGEYVLYDAENPDHAGLERVTVPGAVELHDSFASMPWITSDGSTNCFTTYDCVYLGLDKKLAEKGQEEKLEKAAKVLEFMLSDKAVSLFTDLYPDGYVATKTFTTDESRLYYEYADRIAAGYTQPWYYMYFDNDSIVNTGAKMNALVSGTDGTTMDDVLEELNLRHSHYLNREEDVLFTVPETLDYAQSALLQAEAALLSAQKELDAAGIGETVTAALMPYTTALEDLPVRIPLGVVQMKFYAGDIVTSILNAYINKESGQPAVIRMTGRELNDLVKTGFSITADEYTVDRTFPYELYMADGSKPSADTEYLVAVSGKSLDPAVYETFLKDGKVILKEDGTPVTGNTVEGLTLYAEKHTAEAKQQK